MPPAAWCRKYTLILLIAVPVPRRGGIRGGFAWPTSRISNIQARGWAGLSPTAVCEPRAAEGGRWAGGGERRADLPCLKRQMSPSSLRRCDAPGAPAIGLEECGVSAFRCGERPGCRRYRLDLAKQNKKQPEKQNFGMCHFRELLPRRPGLKPNRPGGSTEQPCAALAQHGRQKVGNLLEDGAKGKKNKAGLGKLLQVAARTCFHVCTCSKEGQYGISFTSPATGKDY